MDSILKAAYLDPKLPGSFGGVERLRKYTKTSRNTVQKFLRGIDSYTLHKDVRKKMKTPVTKALCIDSVWQLDLTEVSKIAFFNKGYTFLLFVIDVFSKFLIVRPLKNKSAEEVTRVFSQILIDTKRHPAFIHVDQGLEFHNSKFKGVLESLGITMFYTGSPNKASIVERSQRTLKERMYRYFTFKNTKKYLDILQDLVDSYNNSVHRSINFRPGDVREKHSEKIYSTLYDKIGSARPPKFSEGDTVRISRLKNFVQKGYTKGWSDEIFTILSVNEKSKPVVKYKIKDSEGVTIKGSFLNEELQLISSDPEAIYSIEKIIKTVGKGANKKHLVKWLHWDESYNSYVLDKDLIK
jgi:transposase InsO family protein